MLELHNTQAYFVALIVIVAVWLNSGGNVLNGAAESLVNKAIDLLEKAVKSLLRQLG